MSSDSAKRDYRSRKISDSTTPGRKRFAERLPKDPLVGDTRGYRNEVFDNGIGRGDPVAGIDSYLSPDNAARYLDVSRKFIYEMIARKEIDAVTVGGRLRRIKISSLEEWLSRCKA
ncbi:MAG: DNA-binding protein [Proteobacteria bacterium]|nr:MAG: DNA-binding protein [Pseudomonadota bacterium]